jgi:hypothetical protein
MCQTFFHINGKIGFAALVSVQINVTCSPMVLRSKLPTFRDNYHIPSNLVEILQGLNHREVCKPNRQDICCRRYNH